MVVSTPVLWPMPSAWAASWSQCRLTAQAAQAVASLPAHWRAFLPSMLPLRAWGSLSQAFPTAAGPDAAAGTRTLRGSD